jgi:mono/diheme cytochrome c family protein
MRYDRLVQPLLDKHCVSCHQPGGEDARAVKFCLTAPQSYEALIRYGQPSLQDVVWAGYRRGHSIPGEGLAQQSSLLAYLRTNPAHANVKLDEDSMSRLVTWMDVYAQRLGSFSLAQENDLQKFRTQVGSLLEEKGK